ncbi:hypothetical protein Tco_0883295 [Tanacetum coccineum]
MDKRPMHAIGNKDKGKQVSTQRYIKGYRVNIPKTKLVYRAVVKPQSDNHVTSNMEQSLDTTKQPSLSDSSNSSFDGAQSLEKEILNAYDDDYEDQFEDYPSSYEEFCDQFNFKVKGRGRN